MKKLSLFILICLFIQYLPAQDSIPRHPKVAVVLSGGGAKGFSHIGALQVLENEGIPIDMIVGTSMGSIIGGLYSIGYSADDLAKLCLTANWTQLLSDNVPRKLLDKYAQQEKERYVLSVPISKHNKLHSIGTGAVNGENVINLFCELTSNTHNINDFSKLPISFACVSTDLISGEKIVLDSGFLPTAIYSSMTIPGVFAPMKIGKYQFVDGGTIDNFPTDVAKKMGADIIIGVNLNKDLKGKNVNSIFDLVGRLTGILTMKKDSTNKALCDVLIEPDLTGYFAGSFSNSAADTLIQRGKEAAISKIEQIRALKTKYDLKPHLLTDSLTELKPQKITKIQFSGNYSLSPKLMLEVMDMHTPDSYTFADIKNAIGSLYGMGVFNRAYFKLLDNDGGKTLDVVLEERNSLDLNVGIRLNSKSMVSVVLNATRKDYHNWVNLLSFTADISTHPKFNFLAELNRRNLPKLAFEMEGSYSLLNVYFTKDYSYTSSIYYGAAKLYTYQHFLRYSLVGAGIKQEYYYGQLNPGTTRMNSDKSITNLYAYYNFDNIDDFYFPTDGTEVYSEFSFANEFKTNNFNPIALLKVRNIQRINSSVVLLTGINGRSVLSSSTPILLNNYLVPQDYEAYSYQQLTFNGLPSVWAAKRNVLIGNIGFRYNFLKNSYITLSTNYLTQSDIINKLKEYTGIWGFGATYAYKTPIGPIQFTLGYSNAYKKAVFSGAIGFWF